MDSGANLIAQTGIFWDHSQIDLGTMKSSAGEGALHNLRAQMTELVWSAAALEGNTLSVTAVHELLEGATLSDSSLEEQKQVLALQETFNYLDELVSAKTFRIKSDTSDELHERVARHEAIESGHFRGFGAVAGGGNVRLSTGETVEGLPAELIVSRFNSLVDVVISTADTRLAALIYFASATRSQFYFDGNKRTARMMASGMLLAQGYDALYIPFERRLEYNKCLDALFTTNNGTDLMQFLASCAR
jgi:Fic family protein